MSTNYMTVNESEIDSLNARLWRLKQAIKKPEKDLGCPKLDAEIMKLRYKVTKMLRDVLFMQNYVWECASEEEYKEWNEKTPDPEELLKKFDLPIDEELAEGQYKDELEICDRLGPDREYLPIYNPLSWWKDLSKKRCKEFEEAAKEEMKNIDKVMAGFKVNEKD